MVTVMPYERVLHYRRGALVGVLQPGKTRLWGLGHRLVDVDLRTSTLTVGLQEVPTSDGIRVKAGASIRWRVTDPVSWHEFSEEPLNLLYDEIKVAVRDVVRTRTLEEVSAGVNVADVPANVAACAADLGAEVDSFGIRDVIVPAEIRRSAEGLVVARQQALTQLEEARGQSAALRSLANVAELLDKHPALAALKLAETASERGGTVIIERPQRSDHG